MNALAVLFLGVISLIYAQEECGSGEIAQCCRRRRQVAFLMGSGIENNDFLAQVAEGVISAELTEVALVACGDGVSLDMTSSKGDVDDEIDRYDDGNDNDLEECLEDGFDTFDDEEAKKVMILAVTRRSDDSNLEELSILSDAIRAEGVEIFGVQLCRDGCDEETAVQLKKIVSFPVDSHFTQLPEEMSAALASAVVGPLRGDDSIACSIFGQATHITTFDGNPYDFQGKGEFWLAKSSADNFNVQVRQEECVADTQTTCSTGFAVNDGSSTLELRFISKTKRLVIYHDGNLQVNQDFWRVGNYYITVSGRHIRDNGEEMHREGWNVFVALQGGGGALKIYFTTLGAMAWVFPRPTDFTSLHGLCGYYDGCQVNDWVGADGLQHESAYGSAMTWSVAEEDSLFRHTISQRYDFPDWEPLMDPATNRDTADELCGDLSGFLMDTCAFDVGAFGSNNAGAASAAMLYETCDIYCSLGTLPHNNIDPHACSHVCDPSSANYNNNLHDKYEDGDIPEHWLDGWNTPEAIFYPSGNIGGKYTLRLNVTNLCETSHREVVINIECAAGFPEGELDAGDRVTAELEPTGYPEVRLNASASAMAVVEAAEGVREAIFSWTFTALPETVYWGIFPDLRMSYDEADDIPFIERDQFMEFVTRNETWSVLGQMYTLDDLYNEEMDLLNIWWRMGSPRIRGNKSPTARFQPLSPGIHKLEFAASDGCQVGVGEVTVVAECPGCDPVASICQTEFDGSMDCVRESQLAMMWNGNGFVDAHFYAEDYFHQSFGVGSRMSHEWWLTAEDRAEDFREEEDGGNLDYVIQVVVGELQVTGTDSGPAVPETITTVGNPSISTTPLWTSYLDDETIQFDHPFNEPPYLYLHAHRNYFSRNTDEATETWTSITQRFGSIEDHCTLELDAYWEENGVADTDRVTVSVSNYADHPEDCEGDYTLHKNSWNTCKFDPDSIPIVVDCGPDPVPFINCVPAVYFDYNSGNFPRISLDGRMSYDLNDLPLEYTWTVTGKPDISRFLNETTFFEFGNPQFEGFGDTTEIQVDNRVGTYQVTLNVDNGCRWHTTTRDIVTKCDLAPIALLSDHANQGNQLEINLGPKFYDGNVLNKTFILNATASYSRDDHPFTTSWTYVDYPPVDWDLIAETELADIIADGIENPLIGEVVGFETGYMRAVGIDGQGNVDRGEFSVRVDVDDGCQIGSLTVTMLQNCDTHLRAKTGASDRVFLDQNQGRVYLTSSSTRHIAADPTYIDLQSFTVTYQWVFLEWPGMELGFDPPELDDDGIDIYNNDTAHNAGFDVFCTPGDPGCEIYDTILNPFGSFNIVPDSFDESNYQNEFGNHRSRNPATESDATSFRPPVVGIYKLKLVVWDGCRYDGTTNEVCDPADLECAQHVTIDVQCQGFLRPTATFQDFDFDPIDGDGNDPETYEVELGTDIYLDGADPNPPGNNLNIGYEWVVSLAPDDSECDPSEPNGCIYQDIFATQGGGIFDGSNERLNVLFTPDAAGLWIVRFNLNAEVCGTAYTEWRFNVVCSTGSVTINGVFSSVDDNNQILRWEDHKFEKVDVWGSHLLLPTLDFQFDVEYWWVVMDAPPDSTYYPQCYDTGAHVGNPDFGNCYNTYNSNFTTYNTTIISAEEFTEFTILTETVTTEEYFSFVTLAPVQPVAEYKEYDDFRACFFADVPGTYTFELNVAIQCGLSEPRTLTINAQCNNPPQVIAECANCVNNEVTLTGSKYARVQLDGTASSDADEQSAPGEVGDRVTYWWEWTVPEIYDEDYEWLLENVVILNRNQPRASFLVKKARDYPVTLYVSDGCGEPVMRNLVVSASCESSLELGDVARRDVPVAYDQVSAVSWLEFDLSQFIDYPFCAQTYTWEVISYTKDADSIDIPRTPAKTPKATEQSSASSIQVTLALFLGLLMAVFAYM